MSSGIGSSSWRSWRDGLVWASFSGCVVVYGLIRGRFAIVGRKKKYKHSERARQPRNSRPSPLRSSLVTSRSSRLRPNGSKFYRQVLPLAYYEMVYKGMEDKYGLNRRDITYLSTAYLLFTRGYVWFRRTDLKPLLILKDMQGVTRQLSDLVHRGWLVRGQDEWHRLQPDQRPPTSRGRGKGVGFYALSQRGKMVVDEITALLTILIREDLERFLIQIGRTIQPT